MRRSVVAVALLALALAPSAGAHVGVAPTLVEPGSSQLFVFTVPNDEGETPVTGLRIGLPRGATLGAVEAKPGWTATSGNGTVSWRGGRIPSGQFTTFALRAAVPQTQGTIFFTARETFADGPGPTFRVSLVVAPIRGGPAPRGSDGGAGTLGKVALGVGIAAAAIAVLAGLLALWVWLRPSRDS